jgi:hypothetical protein
MNPMLQTFPEEDDRPLAAPVPEHPLSTVWLVVLSLLLLASAAIFAF